MTKGLIFTYLLTVLGSLAGIVHPFYGLLAYVVLAILRPGGGGLWQYEVPSGIQGRWTTRDVELHGTVIPEASKVLLLTGPAGRDERAYPDPDRFDVRRDLRNHVSFGYGIHYCVGAALARVEGRIALEETLDRYPAWEVDHERAVRLHTSTVRGYAQVPIIV